MQVIRYDTPNWTSMMGTMHNTIQRVLQANSIAHGTLSLQVQVQRCANLIGSSYIMHIIPFSVASVRCGDAMQTPHPVHCTPHPCTCLPRLRQSKITNLERAVGVHQQVAGFEVSVYYACHVDGSQAQQCLVQQHSNDVFF